MASRHLSDLAPTAQEQAEIIQLTCQEAGAFDLLISCTLRLLEVQTRLYRQSRTKESINQNVKKRGDRFLVITFDFVSYNFWEHLKNAGTGKS